MNTQDAQQTSLVLANGVELVSQIVLAIVGNDLADSLEGEALTNQTIAGLAQARFKEAVQPILGGSQ